MKEKLTTICLYEKTKTRLDAIGNFKESYDALINRILDAFEEKQINQLIKEASGDAEKSE